MNKEKKLNLALDALVDIEIANDHIDTFNAIIQDTILDQPIIPSPSYEKSVLQAMVDVIFDDIMKANKATQQIDALLKELKNESAEA